jgi:uncharacterized membrane protein YdjX (TVP38/TMEM64 family)
MKRLALFWLGTVGVLLGAFVIFGFIDPEFLKEPLHWLEAGGGGAMIASLAVLASDVFLPIPSSVVMMGNGMVFGVWTGTALNLAGGVASALVAFGLGRWAEHLLDRWLSPAEKAHADKVLTNWGWLAIVVSRPIPLLAESIALLAGTSHMRWWVMILATLTGTLPGAWGYAAAGATAGGMDDPWAIAAVVMGIAVLLWFVAVVFRKKGTPADE